MTGIIVTLIFIAGIVLFVLFGRHLSNNTLKTPHWLETIGSRLSNSKLLNALGSIVGELLAYPLTVLFGIVAVLVVIALFLIFFGIPVMLIIKGYIAAASLLF